MSVKFAIGSSENPECAFEFFFRLHLLRWKEEVKNLRKLPMLLSICWASLRFFIWMGKKKHMVKTATIRLKKDLNNAYFLKGFVRGHLVYDNKYLKHALNWYESFSNCKNIYYLNPSAYYEKVLLWLLNLLHIPSLQIFLIFSFPFKKYFQRN